MSTSGPYGSLEMTSGLIQYGVPTKDFLFGSSGDTWAQKPKSDSLTCNDYDEINSANTKLFRVLLTFPSALRRIESDFMSLWMTPCEWRYASAFKHCLHTVAICSSSILRNQC